MVLFLGLYKDTALSVALLVSRENRQAEWRSQQVQRANTRKLLVHIMNKIFLIRAQPLASLCFKKWGKLGKGVTQLLIMSQNGEGFARVY